MGYEGAAPPPPVELGGPDYQEESLQYLFDLLLKKLGQGTHKTYTAGWKRWVWFCRARKCNPYLRGEAQRQSWPLRNNYC